LKGFSTYQKLVIQFADRTRESAVFADNSSSEQYQVTVESDHIDVKQVFSINAITFVLFFPAFIWTEIIELIAADIYSRIAKQRIRRVWLANLISFPVVWFLLPTIPNLVYPIIYIVAESFAVGFEAFFLYLTNKPTHLSVKHAVFVSLVMNAASFGLAAGGIWILLKISP
jgi:hypothetical protein